MGAGAGAGDGEGAYDMIPDVAAAGYMSLQAQQQQQQQNDGQALLYSVAADDTQPVTSVDDLGANLYALEAKDRNAGSSVGVGHDYAVVAVHPRQAQGHDYAAGNGGGTGEVYSVLAEDDGEFC